jgi:hypothetical protein
MAVVSATATPAAQTATPQAPAEPLPAFEVASVRVNKTAQMNRLFRPQPGGRFEATNLVPARPDPVCISGAQLPD